jgi:ribosomal protein L11 methyltransferase
LDVGTGSGILAIAAARLGASRILALDTDRLAVQVARENLALNQVESVVQAQAGTVPVTGQRTSYDLVVANILAETIIQLAPGLACSLSDTGILIVGGIILSRTQALLNSLNENGLSLVEQRAEGEWVTLIARKG